MSTPAHPIRVVSVLLGALLVVLAVFLTANAAWAQAANRAPLPSGLSVTGTADNGATFEGTVRNGRVTVQDGQLMVSGVLEGTLDDGTPVAQPFSVGASVTSDETCTILHLVLGPIHLDLLGLNVDTNEIVIDITGDPSGGLLGELLCALLGP